MFTVGCGKPMGGKHCSWTAEPNSTDALTGGLSKRFRRSVETGTSWWPVTHILITIIIIIIIFFFFFFFLIFNIRQIYSVKSFFNDTTINKNIESAGLHGPGQSGWLPKYNKVFFCGKIFVKIGSVFVQRKDPNCGNMPHLEMLENPSKISRWLPTIKAIPWPQMHLW